MGGRSQWGGALQPSISIITMVRYRDVSYDITQEVILPKSARFVPFTARFRPFPPLKQDVSPGVLPVGYTTHSLPSDPPPRRLHPWRE